ncbi:SLC13 family permease [uncultured Ruthenibacterium sp.]|uniref:SLC13 family permease n=1 Tax=uncultured Ruthenibacterium sp. TaxID=1905347 RepID=UPI00349E9694
MQAYLALGILLITLILFATEFFKPAVTAISASLAMCILGIITPADVEAGFSNTVTLFCFGIAVVGSALAETGCAAYLGKKLMSVFRFGEKGTLIVLMALASVFSMFLSNTSVVVIFMSIAAAMAASSNGKFKKKNLYMGIGMASVAGGGCTLIGSTTQLSINALLPEYGVDQMGMWTLFGPGIGVVIVMLVWYFLVGYKMQLKTFDFPDPDEAVKTDNPKEVKEGNPKDFRMWVPLVVLVFCIALTLINWQDIAIIGLLGAMLVCIFGSISVKRMWETTDWNTLGVIAGGVGFAAGVKSSGAADMVANACINLLGATSPAILYLAVFVILATIMTNVMTNIGTALILTPIALTVAATLGFNAMPFVVGVVWGANMPYSTPIGASVITMTMQGGYRFKDYTKVNIVWNALACIVVIVCTPIFLPLVG